MPVVLTREAVVEHQGLMKARAKRALWRLGICLGIFAGINFGLMVFIPGGPGDTPPAVQAWGRGLGAVALASFLVGTAWFVFSVSRAELQVRCPGCQAAIGNVSLLWKVVASCRCPHCEQVIVGEQGTRFENHIPRNPQQHEDRQESQKALGIMAIGGAAGACWCVAAKLLVDHWRINIEAIVGEVVFPFVSVLFAVPGVLIGAFGMIYACHLLDHKSKKCPLC